jgi:hypothetical protein
MALNKASLEAGLTGMGFEAGKASELATLIDNYVKSANVNPGTFSNSGGPVAGVGTLS